MTITGPIVYTVNALTFTNGGTANNAINGGITLGNSNTLSNFGTGTFSNGSGGINFANNASGALFITFSGQGSTTISGPISLGNAASLGLTLAAAAAGPSAFVTLSNINNSYNGGITLGTGATLSVGFKRVNLAVNASCQTRDPVVLRHASW